MQSDVENKFAHLKEAMLRMAEPQQLSDTSIRIPQQSAGPGTPVLNSLDHQVPAPSQAKEAILPSGDINEHSATTPLVGTRPTSDALSDANVTRRALALTAHAKAI